MNQIKEEHIYVLVQSYFFQCLIVTKLKKNIEYIFHFLNMHERKSN